MDAQAGFAPTFALPGPTEICLSQDRIWVWPHDQAGTGLGQLLPSPTCQICQPKREVVLAEEVHHAADPCLTMHLVNLMDLSGLSVNKQHLT